MAVAYTALMVYLSYVHEISLTVSLVQHAIASSSKEIMFKIFNKSSNEATKTGFSVSVKIWLQFQHIAS